MELNVTEWKLDIIFLLQVGLALWLWRREKKIPEIMARLEELVKVSRIAIAGRHSAAKLFRFLKSDKLSTNFLWDMPDVIHRTFLGRIPHG